MALKLYSRFPLVPQNELTLVDTFTSVGAASFTLTNKTTTYMAGTVQAGTQYYSRAIGGFTVVNSSTFTLSSAPPVGAQIVVPGTSTLTFAGYDQVTVAGVTGAANVIQASFYIGEDGTNIASTQYGGAPGTNGIAIFFSNLCTAAGAQVSWSQLSCANAAGNVIGYQATGTTLYVHPFLGFTTLAASSAASATTFVVVSASAFTVGDYVWVNLGNGSQENVTITAINYGTNTITCNGFNYGHYSGETVFMNCLKCWAQITIPVNALGGLPANLINLGIGFTATQISRL